MSFEKLPPEIFEAILLMIPKSIDACKEVCWDWNSSVMKNLWDSPSRSWGPIIKARIERSWGTGVLPSDEKIAHAKLLKTKDILTICRSPPYAAAQSLSALSSHSKSCTLNQLTEHILA